MTKSDTFREMQSHYYQEYMRRNFPSSTYELNSFQDAVRHIDFSDSSEAIKTSISSVHGLTAAAVNYCCNDVIVTDIIKESVNSQMHAIKIEKVIKNDDAVIVFWTDKTKTVVKLMAGDTDDIYSAVAQAMAKKIYGGTGKFHSHVNKVLKDYTTPEELQQLLRMAPVINSTVSGFKNFFDGIWNLSHPKGTDRYSGDEN